MAAVTTFREWPKIHFEVFWKSNVPNMQSTTDPRLKLLAVLFCAKQFPTYEPMFRKKEEKLQQNNNKKKIETKWLDI